jgi:hypothetical protein
MIYLRHRLTDAQYADALAISGRINHNSQRFKRQPKYGQDHGARFAQSEDGTLASKAFAVMLGVPYNPSNGLDWRVDDYWIRSTSREKGCLLLHEKDDPNQKYVLLIGFRHEWGIAGWCWGVEGKQRAHWRDDVRCPAFFVPQRVLHAWPPDLVQLALL